MRLLKRDKDGNFSFTANFVGSAQDQVPPYAILSHTWGLDGEEITYTDILTADDSQHRKPGIFKLWLCAEQAAQDGLEYIWVDTCCINKSDSTELNEDINSMFSWYAKAAVCYVYLSDVEYEEIHNYKELESSGYQETQAADLPQLRSSRWFTRGWTVQELLAPRDVRFFSSNWTFLFSKDDDNFQGIIHELTKIPIPALRGEVPLASFGVDERFSWAVSRQTTRPEDMAYCLLGIFDVFIPLIYGEGRENALHRLQRAIEEKEYQRALVAFTPKQAPAGPSISTAGLMQAFVGGVGGSLATLGFLFSKSKLVNPSQETKRSLSTASPSVSPSMLPSVPAPVAHRNSKKPRTQETEPTARVEPRKDAPEQTVAQSKPSVNSKKGRVVLINAYRLLESDLLDVLTELFPEIPREEMEMDKKHGNYRVWLPRDLTAEEHQTIAKKRTISREEMALGVLPTVLASHRMG